MLVQAPANQGATGRTAWGHEEDRHGVEADSPEKNEIEQEHL